MRYNIEVIGNLDFVLGFGLAGIKGKTFSNKEDLIKYVNTVLKNKERKIIIMDQNSYVKLPEKVKEKIIISVSPLFIILGKEEDLKLMIKRVLGIEISNF